MAVDTLLNNRFAIADTGLKPLDRGGMAVIYAGTDTETDQPIAAKTLLADYQGDPHRRERFRREGEVLRAVQHPYIVELVDVVDDRRGSWILMERLEGEPLSAKLRREGAFDPKTVNRWLAQVCAALEHLHQLGYVHLDVTPQNLFLTTDGDIKLIDFGIAQRAYTPPKRDGNTLLGTAVYMSPEHGTGDVVTPLSDIYSLGCVVFELLTDRKVFSEWGELANDATITVRQNAVPELPSSVAPQLGLPGWVDTVVANALMPSPGDRFPSATAFAEEFNAHANPPLFRLSWLNRQRQSGRASASPAQEPVPVPTMPQPVREAERPAHKEPTRAGRWLRKELRNARRVLLVFALLVSMVFAVPMVGGSAVFDWLLGSIPGSNTHVIDGNWYMRAGPTTESDIRTLMMDGQSVRVTGTPVNANNQMWWPVSTEVDGERMHGWAHDDGLARTWLMNRAAGFELFRDTWSQRWDTLTGFLPG